MNESEQPTVDPYEASGEPTLKPVDYDFAVAGAAESIKERLDHAEGKNESLDTLARKNIAMAALGSRDDEGGDPYQTGHDIQDDLKQASKDVDVAFDAAKRHYRENADQYVENAAQEYEVVRKDREEKVNSAP